jgi:RNA polymerase sigma factor (sigma-70 family)
MPLKRDAPTFLQVLESNKGIIYKIANSYCRDTENRKDLIQEITIQLWLSFGKYDEKYKLSTWIYRIALNVAISGYRRESRRTVFSNPFTDDLLYLKEEPSQNEEITQLFNFIKELKEIDRAVILLYLEGNNHQEIGEILGLSVTNVSTKVGRIKQLLKRKFSTINN